jgi:hypothetical protein
MPLQPRLLSYLLDSSISPIKAVRPNGLGVACSVLELGALQIRTLELSAPQLCPVKLGAPQIRLLQLGAPKPRTLKFKSSQAHRPL